jgi:hypothetical protein
VKISTLKQGSTTKEAYSDESYNGVQDVEHLQCPALLVWVFDEELPVKADGERQEYKNEKLLDADTNHVDMETSQDLAHGRIFSRYRGCPKYLDDECTDRESVWLMEREQN